MRGARAGLALAILVVSGACGGDARTQDSRPNLLLVLTDDQRYDSLGCAGSDVVPTPNLDRIAREGTFFERAYVTTSLCCPARASLYTSLYPHLTGIRNNEDRTDFLREHVGLGEALQRAGYETAFFGKWHIHNPGALPQPGFDHWVSFEGQGQYEDETFTIGVEAPERRKIRGFNTDILFDLAIEWIERPREKPFLAILSLKNLHRPYFPPERHRASAPRGPFPVPASAEDEAVSAVIAKARQGQRNSWFDDGTTHEGNLSGYHQMVLSIDDNVGRMLDALERERELDRTAVAMTSDGGFMWGEHGMYRKRTAYEPSIRVPLILRLPGIIPASTRVEDLVLGIDVAPTFLDLARTEAPATWQGRSLLPPLQGEPNPPWREDFLYTDGWGKFVDGPTELAVVGERYKYVLYRRDVIEEALFDREADPDERVNLALDPAQAERLAHLRTRMTALLAEVQAPPSWTSPVESGSARDD